MKAFFEVENLQSNKRRGSRRLETWLEFFLKGVKESSDQAVSAAVVSLRWLIKIEQAETPSFRLREPNRLGSSNRSDTQKLKSLTIE